MHLGKEKSKAAKSKSLSSHYPTICIKRGNGVDRIALMFTSSFQILDPTTEMKDSGGIHNTTLDLGPPAQFVHAGRYICLVNNPEGHTHKEIFVRVLTDSQMQAFPTSGNGQPQSPASGKLFYGYTDTS